MTNPEAGYFHDRDLLFKFLHAGYRCVLSRYTKAQHARSRGDSSKEKRRKDAETFAKINPLVTVSWNKERNPVCRYTPMEGVPITNVGPCSLAQNLVLRMRTIFQRGGC